jgi:hypothetical protein
MTERLGLSREKMPMSDHQKYYIPRIDQWSSKTNIIEVFLQPSAVGNWLIHTDEHPIPSEVEGMHRFEEGVHCFSTKADALKKLRKLRDAKVRKLKREIEALQAVNHPTPKGGGF